MSVAWERFVTAVAKGVALAIFEVQAKLPEVIAEVASEKQKEIADRLRPVLDAGRVSVSSPRNDPGHEYSPQTGIALRDACGNDETGRATRAGEDES